MKKSETWCKVNETIEKVLAGGNITFEEVERIYNLDADSEEAFLVRWAGLKLGRTLSGNIAEIHAQIGLDAGPCIQSCKFCSFAKGNCKSDHFLETPHYNVLAYAEMFQKAGANSLLLMMSAGYPFEKYLKMAEEVRQVIGPDMPLLSNTCDISESQAIALREAGFNGSYHTSRMGEGIITDIPAERREQTLNNLKKAGLPLSVCVEPIGEEHTALDFYEKALFHMQFDPVASGIGRRIPVKGCPTEHDRKFTQNEQAVLIALYRLIDRKTPYVGSANATMAADAGANLCWAEVGFNPRDCCGKTEIDGTGRSVKFIANVFKETGWELRKGYSDCWNMK